MKNWGYVTVWLVASFTLLAAAVAQQKTPERTFSSVGQVRTEPLDVGVLIVAWQDQHHTLAEKLGQVFKPVVDAVASGSKLTKADAAKVQEWFESIVRYNAAKGESVVLLNMREHRNGQGAGDPTAKQPEDKCRLCGSKEHSTQSCPLRNIELLDYDGPKLDTIPITNPVFTPPSGWTKGSSTGKPGGRLVSPQRLVVVFLLGDIAPKTNEEKQAMIKLVAQGVEEARTSPSRLVIKTKSTPP